MIQASRKAALWEPTLGHLVRVGFSVVSRCDFVSIYAAVRPQKLASAPQRVVSW